MTHEQALRLKEMIGMLGSLCVRMGAQSNPRAVTEYLAYHKQVNDFVTSCVTEKIRGRDYQRVIVDELHDYSTAEIAAAMKRNEDHAKVFARAKVTHKGLEMTKTEDKRVHAELMSREDIEAHQRSMQPVSWFNDLAG